METREFLIEARVDDRVLAGWIEAGWLLPVRHGRTSEFSDVDLARAQLIHELTYRLGVNAEGVGIILDLLDQLHGVRRRFREFVIAVRPELARTRNGAAPGEPRTRSAKPPARKPRSEQK